MQQEPLPWDNPVWGKTRAQRESEWLNGLTKAVRDRIIADRKRDPVSTDMYERMHYRAHRRMILPKPPRRRMTPDQVKEKAWMAHIRRAYGLTAEEYAMMHERQGGVCAICRLPERMRGGRVRGGSKVMRLAIDHDHDTGKVRGLLCKACNTGIGTLNHDVKLLKAAIAYLGSYA